MPFCELCGRQIQDTKKVSIEGAIFNVCIGCSKLGKQIITKPKFEMPNSNQIIGNPQIKQTRPITMKRKMTSNYNKITLTDEVILDSDYHKMIREARTKKGLTHEELGMKLNEKVTLLKKIESGTIKPDQQLAKKIERFLGIKLYVPINSEE